jgi:hypothetical protein
VACFCRRRRHESRSWRIDNGYSHEGFPSSRSMPG